VPSEDVPFIVELIEGMLVCLRFLTLFVPVVFWGVLVGVFFGLVWFVSLWFVVC
jgi:hypothetical protein